MKKRSDWKNKYATKTAFDDLELDISEITDIIRETIEVRNKYLKRAELKPMAKTRADKDSHDTSRALHMRQAAEIAKSIAHKLGLNETIAYTGMLMHDAGHAFFGHEGEHTMNVAGKLLNVGYFHHNAKGIDVIMSENLIGKIIDAIPEAKNNPGLRKKLEKDAWYFLDVVVSHDGEASLKENKITKKSEENTDIKEAVLSKARKSNRENVYKCEPETLEAVISKPSDVIAYIKSDMMDAFSEGIITKFDDDHFEVIGGILCETRGEREQKLDLDDGIVKKERIEKGKKLLLEYRKKHLRELPEDIDQEKLGIAENILKQAETEGINIFNVYTKEDMEAEINDLKARLKKENNTVKEYNQKIKESKVKFANKYRESVIAQRRINEILENRSNEYRAEQQAKGIDNNTIESDIKKIEEYTQKLAKDRKRVVEDIMNDIQIALINDYVETTKENWESADNYEEMKARMGFSKGMSKLLYNKLKVMDYEKYVQFTKKIYQEKSVPSAVHKTIKECAQSLVKTGVIRNKFYDQMVLSRVKDDEVREHMKVPERDEEKYEEYKRRIGISKGVKLIRLNRKEKKKKFTLKKGIGNIHRRKLYKDMYIYVQSQDTRFAMNCEDVYYAIDNTVRTKVADAYSEKFIPDDYLKEEQLDEMRNIRNRVEEIQQDLIDGRIISVEEERKCLEEAKKQYIDETVKKERENLEEKVAQEIAIKYIAGMTDRKIVDTLLKIGNLSWIRYRKEDKINKEGNKVVKGLAESHKEASRQKNKDGELR